MREFRPPNFITGDIGPRIAHVETRDVDFAQMEYIAFLYALRVTSEALPPKRAFPTDELRGFSPMMGKAFIGVMGAPPNAKLALRFSSRKNPPHVLLLARGQQG